MTQNAVTVARNNGEPQRRLALVVDDEPENRALYRRMLSTVCDVVEAGNGDEALAVARAKTLDVVVTDQRMPGMLGTELLERMQDICPNVPKIVVTAYSDMVPVLLAINSCALFGYLIKPLEATQLTSLVTRAIQEHANRSNLLDMIGRLDAENERLRKVNEQLLQAAKRLTQSHTELRKNCDALEGAYAKMSQLAQRDELTQLRNRRNFIESLSSELTRCRRYGRSATLILLDVDGLQKINAAHGEAVGDSVLRVLARAIQNHVRTNDLAFRIGGDEFAVLLPETSGGAVTVVCDKLTAVLRSTTIPELNVALEVSMGVQSTTEGVGSADDWYALADAALDAAKERRNGA